MKAFIVFNYWNVPSQNFENYHKPPFRLTKLIFTLVCSVIPRLPIVSPCQIVSNLSTIQIQLSSRYNLSVTKCHTVARRWLREGLVTCWLSNTISVAIVLPSCGVNVRYQRWSHELTGCPHDGLAIETLQTRWTHEVNTKTNLCEDLWQFFLHAKYFVTTPEVAAEPLKSQPEVIRE